MELNCYLNFDGNCKEALDFYEKAFSCKAQAMTFGDAPENPQHPLPAAWKTRIMHAQLPIGETVLLCADVAPNHQWVCGNNITLSLSSNDQEKLRSWYTGLLPGSNQIVPLGPTFWSPLYGYLIDQYGIGWQINCREDAGA